MRCASVESGELLAAEYENVNQISYQYLFLTTLIFTFLPT